MKVAQSKSRYNTLFLFYIGWIFSSWCLTPFYKDFTRCVRDRRPAIEQCLLLLMYIWILYVDQKQKNKHFGIFPVWSGDECEGKGVLWWLGCFCPLHSFIKAYLPCQIDWLYVIYRLPRKYLTIGDVSLSCERLYVLGVCIFLKAITPDLWYSPQTPSVRLSLPDCPERYLIPQIAHHPTFHLTSIHVNTNNLTHRCRHIVKIEDVSCEKCVFMYIFGGTYL